MRAKGFQHIGHGLRRRGSGWWRCTKTVCRRVHPAGCVPHGRRPRVHGRRTQEYILGPAGPSASASGPPLLLHQRLGLTWSSRTSKPPWSYPTAAAPPPSKVDAAVNPVSPSTPVRPPVLLPLSEYPPSLCCVLFLYLNLSAQDCNSPWGVHPAPPLTNDQPNGLRGSDTSIFSTSLHEKWASLPATGKEQLLVAHVEKVAAAAAASMERAVISPPGKTHMALPVEVGTDRERERGAAAGDLPKSGIGAGGRRRREQAAGDGSRGTGRRRPSRWSPRRSRSHRWAAAQLASVQAAQVGLGRALGPTAAADGGWAGSCRGQ